MDFGHDTYGQPDSFEETGYANEWHEDTSATSTYKPYDSTQTAEPEAVEVYREMLETPAIEEDHAEFLESRINDLLER
ncbi:MULTISPECIES: hypothetical protein [Haloferacaceae]|uniref:Uncharacterized protein n=1 Tax=Halorubrum glutamatedens TaxID=2707018 RepID=A0ABD5QN51_9EURY|nr:hypothetical protein [Halobellus captivus]